MVLNTRIRSPATAVDASTGREAFSVRVGGGQCGTRVPKRKQGGRQYRQENTPTKKAAASTGTPYYCTIRSVWDTGAKAEAGWSAVPSRTHPYKKSSCKYGETLPLLSCDQVRVGQGCQSRSRVVGGTVEKTPLKKQTAPSMGKPYYCTTADIMSLRSQSFDISQKYIDVLARSTNWRALLLASWCLQTPPSTKCSTGSPDLSPFLHRTANTINSSINTVVPSLAADI